MAVLMIWFPARLLAVAAAIRAILLDSEPPEVKMISLGATFKVPAMISAASLIYCSPSMPFLCLADGLP
ncbi:hypothetical protein D3C81_2197660 [compost metagenome]